MTGTVWSIGSSWTGYEGMAAVPDVSGVLMYVTSVVGWHGAPAPRTAPVDVPQGDGVFDGQSTQPARSIGIGGEMKAPNQIALLQAVDRMTNLLVAGNRYDTLTVAEAHVSRQVTVRRDAETTCEPVSLYRATYSMILLAPDPARYSTAVSTSGPEGIYTGGAGRTYTMVYPRVYGALGSDGILQAVNNGVGTVYPTLTFTGPLVNPAARLVNGNRLAFNISLASGDVLTVTTGQPNRSVLLNGSTSARNAMTSDSAWWALAPGPSQVLFTADSGSGSFSMSWRETG